MFYYIYRSFIKVKDKIPVASSSFILTILQLFITLGFIVLIEVLFKISLIDKVGKVAFLFISFLLVFINLGFLMFNNKYLKICEKYEKLPAEVHKKNWKIVIAVKIGTFIFVLIASFFKARFGIH